MEQSSYALAFHDTFVVIAAGLILIGSVFAVLYSMQQRKVRAELAVESRDSPGGGPSTEVPAFSSASKQLLNPDEGSLISKEPT
jgi:hypothetical protein